MSFSTNSPMRVNASAEMTTFHVTSGVGVAADVEHAGQKVASLDHQGVADALALVKSADTVFAGPVSGDLKDLR